VPGDGGAFYTSGAPGPAVDWSGGGESSPPQPRLTRRTETARARLIAAPNLTVDRLSQRRKSHEGEAQMASPQVSWMFQSCTVGEAVLLAFGLSVMRSAR